MAGLLDRVKFLFTGRMAKNAQPSPMHSRVDAAQTTDENKRHWAQADSFSADAAYDPATRFRLRNRSRYEVLNNCYAKNVVRSSADDMIGTGPRLQLSIPGDDSGEAAKVVERNYGAWCDETKLAMKFHMAEKSRVRDGGCFGLFDTNERLRNPVKFDTRWLEAEMCATPFNMGNDPQLIDGIKFDRMGNPETYYFLVNHPGGLLAVGLIPTKFYTMPSERVIHWFTPDRFGQHRELPELTPALPIYSQTRRWTLATLTAAEFAAMLAGVMKTKGDPNTQEPAAVEHWEMFEMVRGALLTLPDGWDATQFKSENPPIGYGDFKRELLNESGCATGHPLNRVTGNSSGYNFSSGRLDHLPYQRGHTIRRNDLRLVGIDRVFRDGWYPEAVLVGQVPAGLPDIAEWRWSWNWDGFDSIDQNKDAMADDTRIKDGTTNYAEIYSAYGQDWQQQFEQMAKEKAYAAKLGLPWPLLTTAPSAGGNGASQQPQSLEQTVQMAFDQADIDESTATDLMEALRPTFDEVRSRSQRNGFHKVGGRS